ncbi:hypothetical protein IIB50_01280 [Patescibacteria group bacterium]|nr:hypothetical protein [Patescibacteria group bacterium]
MKKMRNILFILLTLAVAFAIYSYFFTGDRSTTSLLVSEQINTGGESSVERELLVLLLELRSVELTGNIFDSLSFKSLTDFGQELIPEPVGRPNPFAPIGVE